MLHGDVSEMVTIDNGTTAPGQNLSELGATIVMTDSTRPFDYHLTHHILDLCKQFGTPHQRNVSRYYHSDSASAVEAGNDLRTALICFGVDASHGHERIHRNALESLVRLVTAYMRSERVVARERYEIGPRKGFPTLPG